MTLALGPLDEEAEVDLVLVDPLRTDAVFMRLLGLAAAGHRKAVAACTEAGGERVPGISLS